LHVGSFRGGRREDDRRELAVRENGRVSHETVGHEANESTSYPATSSEPQRPGPIGRGLRLAAIAVADVALLVGSADEPARQTLTAAMTREGWRVADGPPAACAVVVWSEQSVTSDGLAALARPFLDERRLLQVLWQPDAWDNSDRSCVEAPE